MAGLMGKGWKNEGGRKMKNALYEKVLTILVESHQLDSDQLCAIAGSLYFGIDHDPEGLQRSIGTRFFAELEREA